MLSVACSRPEANGDGEKRMIPAARDGGPSGGHPADHRLNRAQSLTQELSPPIVNSGEPNEVKHVLTDVDANDQR